MLFGVSDLLLVNNLPPDKIGKSGERTNTEGSSNGSGHLETLIVGEKLRCEDDEEDECRKDGQYPKDSEYLEHKRLPHFDS